jgi:uncharacterized repeat protein (TIGR03803 family)
MTTLCSFCSQSGCADGEEALAGLVQATNGDLYGTTASGGANNGGTVFKITPSGTLTTLYSFTCPGVFGDCADGQVAGPSGLVQATDGDFYGTTSYGGENDACPLGLRHDLQDDSRWHFDNAIQFLFPERVRVRRPTPLRGACPGHRWGPLRDSRLRGGRRTRTPDG